MRLLKSTVKRFKTWLFTRPELEDPSDSKIARILDIFFLFGIFACISIFLFKVIISVLNLPPVFAMPFWVAVSICLLSIGHNIYLRTLLKKQRLKAVGLSIATSFLLMPPIMLSSAGFSHTHVTLYYAVSLVIAATILGSRFTYFFAGLAIVSLGIVNLIAPQGTGLDTGQFISFVICITVLVLILKLETSSRTSLKEALAQSKHELSERIIVQQQLSHNTLHDALTGLANRNLIHNRIDLALQHLNRDATKKFAVLFLDIDRFKIINDSLGHALGDKTLTTFAAILKSQIRATDTVARLGGDEFVILLEDINDYHSAIVIATSILDTLETPITINNKLFTLSSSIGIAFGDPDYTQADEILRDADLAMYQSKENGRGRYTIFNDEIRQEVFYRLELANSFLIGLARNEFIIHYQPIIDLKTNNITGMEALSRWQHPTKGLIFPDTYIPIAVESGLIAELDHYVINQACQQILSWKNKGMLASDVYLSINLSPICLKTPNYATTTSTLVESLGFDMDCLVLEITEGQFIADLDESVRIIESFQSKGIKISIDDFGTGYSSLSYLHRLPINIMKIDRSFVINLNKDSKNKSIIEMIVTLAKSLELTIVAEGIETSEQLDYLRTLSCDSGQGYFFTRSLSVDDIESYITASFMPYKDPLFNTPDKNSSKSLSL